MFHPPNVYHREYERDLNLFMLDVAPSILARKGYNARMKIGDAFTQYFEDYISKRIQSSAMIFSRYTANIRYDVSFGNQGRLEVGALIGILSNTIPSLFYMLVHIYADHELLHNIREELENTAMLTCDNSKKILILSMRKKCHLLRSTFQEVLRFHAKGVGSRYVREDTILDGQYFLKKGMVVQIPMAVMHLDPTIWGPDAEEFKPDRFLGKSDGQNKPKPDDEVRLGENGEKNSKHIPTGYRPFGGGASLCPGRHWVTLEALALTAIMVLRFDIRPINREWNIPSQNQMNLAVDVFPPAYDIKVAIKKRKGMEDTNWEYLME